MSWANQFTDVGTGVGSGVIDSDYRGNVAMIFFKFSNNYPQIRQRDKTAQIAFKKIASHTKLAEVNNFDDTISRSEKDFGSTDSKCRNDL